MTLPSLTDLVNKIIDVNDFSLSRDILEEYQGDDWREYVKINDERYNKEKVYVNDSFEILILTWGVNQKASIHNHAENGCFLKMLDGDLEETLYDHQLNEIETRHLSKNQISYMNNNIGLHCVKNKSDKIAVSIHIYSPPNHLTKFY
jgi:cysteine dioxygenase